MTPDQFNGAFEFVGGCCSWLNVFTYLKDRQIKGIFWPSSFFYNSWGWFNIYFYSTLLLPYSLWGGIFLTSGSTTWLMMIIRDKYFPSTKYQRKIENE